MATGATEPWLPFVLPLFFVQLLRGRKFLQIIEKYDFRGENFHGLLTFAAPKDATPQISRKNFCV